MLENWIWDSNILQKVSKHYQTGEPMPKDVIDEKVANKNKLGALNTISQLNIGISDFLLHSASDSKLLA